MGHPGPTVSTSIEATPEAATRRSSAGSLSLVEFRTIEVSSRPNELPASSSSRSDDCRSALVIRDGLPKNAECAVDGGVAHRRDRRLLANAARRQRKAD